MAIIPPLPLALPTPSDEAVWHAVSENEWQMARRADTSDRSIDLWTLSKAVCKQTDRRVSLEDMTAR